MRVRERAHMSVWAHGPGCVLHVDARARCCEGALQRASWPGVGRSVATSVLHLKGNMGTLGFGKSPAQPRVVLRLAAPRSRRRRSAFLGDLESAASHKQESGLSRAKTAIVLRVCFKSAR